MPSKPQRLSRRSQAWNANSQARKAIPGPANLSAPFRADFEEYQARLAEEITRLFPGCPPGRATAIAQHTGMRGSGRVGRSAAGRALDKDAVTLAVIASVRHLDTRYDALLMSGIPRDAAGATTATLAPIVHTRHATCPARPPSRRPLQRWHTQHRWLTRPP